MGLTTFETKRKICELMVKEIRVGKNTDGETMFNIKCYFDKDLLKSNKEFEQLSKSIRI